MVLRSFSFAFIISIICAATSYKDDRQAADTSSTYADSFNQWMDSVFDATVDRSPVMQTQFGIKKDYDKWTDLSDRYLDQEISITKAELVQLQKWDTSMLDDHSKLSYNMFKDQWSQKIAGDEFRYYNYPAHQMRGVHDFIPTFLINFHKISDIKDAEDYIERVRNGDTYLNQAVEQMKKRQDLGVMPPSFVFPHIIRSAVNIIQGEPFTAGEDCAILDDFKKKLNAIYISNEEKSRLIDDLNQALTVGLLPMYTVMIDYLKEAALSSDARDGVWKLDHGDAYYRYCLKVMTTTDMEPTQIFNVGMSEIKRIHSDMKNIMTSVNFKGDLQAFFTFMRSDDQFYLPGTDEGRATYLKMTNDKVDRMRGRMDDLFHTKPKADLVVKAVEAYREQSAGKAFYNRPSPDGSRPGTYYANLYDMRQMPTYQMEALLHHEAIPGHHMQISINQELEGLPKFRRLAGRYTAYTEGWGLYSEYIPKELGFYEDPYSDFGRLAMELWRACRLVVDVGIHHKKWTREQGINFYKENTPNAEADCIKMVERHIVMPGQATSYKIGQLKILELKNRAEKILADKFDIRDFHEVILTNGAVPLDILESLVDQYIASKK